MVNVARRLLLGCGIALIAICSYWLALYPHLLRIDADAINDGTSSTVFILRQLIPQQLLDASLGIAFVTLWFVTRRRPRTGFLLSLPILIVPIMVLISLIADGIHGPVIELNYGVSPRSLHFLSRMFTVIAEWGQGGPGFEVDVAFLGSVYKIAVLLMLAVPLLCLVLLPVCFAGLVVAQRATFLTKADSSIALQADQAD